MAKGYTYRGLLPDGREVTRTTHRTYTHLVATQQRGESWGVWSFCGSRELAEKAGRQASRAGLHYCIVPVTNPRPDKADEVRRATLLLKQHMEANGKAVEVEQVEAARYRIEGTDVLERHGPFTVDVVWDDTAGMPLARSDQ